MALRHLISRMAAIPGMSVAGRTEPGMDGNARRLHQFEIEPEVRDWLDRLDDSGFKRVDELCG